MCKAQRGAASVSVSARIALRRARKAHEAIERELSKRPRLTATRVGLINGRRQVYVINRGRP